MTHYTTWTAPFIGQNGNQGVIYGGYETPFVVPQGVTSVDVELLGSVGGGDANSSTPWVPGTGGGGKGGLLRIRISVTPGETLIVCACAPGNPGSSFDSTVGGKSDMEAFGGTGWSSGGSGGGFSSIRRGTTHLGIAGGGGAAGGGFHRGIGGDGGFTATAGADGGGTMGVGFTGGGGQPGTASTPGAAGTGAHQGTAGGADPTDSSNPLGGGAGAQPSLFGWYGGGGGGAGHMPGGGGATAGDNVGDGSGASSGGGGGGGCSYAAAGVTVLEEITGYNAGVGSVALTFATPAPYIVDAVATTYNTLGPDGAEYNDDTYVGGVGNRGGVSLDADVPVGVTHTPGLLYTVVPCNVPLSDPIYLITPAMQIAVMFADTVTVAWGDGASTDYSPGPDVVTPDFVTPGFIDSTAVGGTVVPNGNGYHFAGAAAASHTYTTEGSFFPSLTLTGPGGTTYLRRWWHPVVAYHGRPDPTSRLRYKSSAQWGGYGAHWLDVDVLVDGTTPHIPSVMSLSDPGEDGIRWFNSEFDLSDLALDSALSAVVRVHDYGTRDEFAGGVQVLLSSDSAVCTSVPTVGIGSFWSTVEGGWSTPHEIVVGLYIGLEHTFINGFVCEVRCYQYPDISTNPGGSRVQYY